jgi:hypothetical protein
LRKYEEKNHEIHYLLESLCLGTYRVKPRALSSRKFFEAEEKKREIILTEERMEEI